MGKGYLVTTIILLLLGTPNDKPDQRFGMVFQSALKPFYHGVASGDPLSDRVIIWTRVTSENDGPVEVLWQIATDTHFLNVVHSGTVTTGVGLDYTVKVDVDGLEPGKQYYYVFSALGAKSPIGRTKTTPTGNIDHIRLGVVTGSNYQWGVFNGYANMAKRDDLDAFIHTGDYLYETPSGVYAHPNLFSRDHFPDKELLTLNDYRQRYSQYRLDGDVQRLHQQLPMLAQWDDHEHANDCWVNGAANHDPALEGDWNERVAASIRAYSEWMPVRMAGPEDRNIYRSFSFGNLLDLFLTESRLVGRDKQLLPKGNIGEIDVEKLYDPDRTLLGEDQLNWLLDGLTQSTARWKIVSSSILMSRLFSTQHPYGNMDAWDGYPVERETLFRAITEAGITNFGVISGDLHIALASHLVPQSSYQQYEETGEGAVGFEFTAPSVTSANFNELGETVLANGLRINPLAIHMAERHPLTLLVEQEIMRDNANIKYLNIDQHGYLIIDFNLERAQAEWYYSDSLLIHSSKENLGAVWSVQNESTDLNKIQ